MDREALLEIENAVLRVAGTYESILRAEAVEAMFDVLHRYITFQNGGITTTDGPGAFRALALTRDMGPIVPYRARLPSSLAVYETVYLKQEPLLRRHLGDDPLDRFAKTAGIQSFSVFPIPGSNGKVIASLYLGFTEADANDRVPPELAKSLTEAIGPFVERGLQSTREHRALRILDTSGDAMLAWDADGRITDLNIAAERMIGGSRAQILGTKIDELLGSTPRGPSQGQRFTLRSRSGATIPVAGTVSLVTGDPLVMAHALLRDLSDIVATEETAAEHVAELRTLTKQRAVLLDNAPLLIFRLDPETRELLYLNRHAERLFGVSAAEALATPGFLRALHLDAEGRAAFEAAVDTAKRGAASATYEARLGRGGAEPVTARGTIYPILGAAPAGRDATGRDPGAPVLLGIEGILLDVTGERDARTRLVQADRLATVGMLAAGVAHEINNPAAFMLLGLDALSRQLGSANVQLSPPADENVKQLVADLRETESRIVDIARDMRLFASPPGAYKGRRVAVDVARTVESALTITRAQIIERAEILVDIQPDLPPVLMEEGRLGQVLVNLLLNAAQSFATPELGRKPSQLSGPPDAVRVTACASGEKVLIAIEDTGCGMTEAVRERIFTPFFTTKGAAVGTGLGLAISKAIVESAAGVIRATSPISTAPSPRGSRFEVELPAYAEEILRSTTPVPKKPPPRARVLVVEDETLLGRALVDQLAEVHDVSLAAGGAEGLRCIREARFDAVLCDLRMPGVSGEMLYREVAQTHPEMARRFIFMTGVGFGVETERFIAEVGAPMLEKPFALRRALDTIASIVEPRLEQR